MPHFSCWREDARGQRVRFELVSPRERNLLWGGKGMKNVTFAWPSKAASLDGVEELASVADGLVDACREVAASTGTLLSMAEATSAWLESADQSTQTAARVMRRSFEVFWDSDDALPYRGYSEIRRHGGITTLKQLTHYCQPVPQMRRTLAKLLARSPDHDAEYLAIVAYAMKTVVTVKVRKGHRLRASLETAPIVPGGLGRKILSRAIEKVIRAELPNRRMTTFSNLTGGSDERDPDMYPESADDPHEAVHFSLFLQDLRETVRHRTAAEKAALDYYLNDRSPSRAEFARRWGVSESALRRAEDPIINLLRGRCCL